MTYRVLSCIPPYRLHECMYITNVFHNFRCITACISALLSEKKVPNLRSYIEENEQVERKDKTDERDERKLKGCQCPQHCIYIPVYFRFSFCHLVSAHSLANVYEYNVFFSTYFLFTSAIIFWY